MDGVWNGVGSVVVFLPQILLLFLFIGILEDSGYLARAALIADRTMARVGLQGKSFIPLLSAYACAVPAIMATRTIENKRDRIATILIAPFMTCSARLPVYTLMIAAFIPEPADARAVPGRARGGDARPVRARIRGGRADGAAAEVVGPEEQRTRRSCWRCRPTAGPRCGRWVCGCSTASKVFLRRAGTVILLVTVVLWVLAHLPLQQRPDAADRAELGGHDRPHHRAGDPAAGIQLEDRDRTDHVAGGARSDRRHAGDDLRHGRRVAVDRICSTRCSSDLTLGAAVALLIFFAFAMQCMSTMAVVRRETGGWKWPMAQFTYMGMLAYVGAFLANHVVR